MKKKVNITLDEQAYENLKDKAKRNGLSLSSFLNMLGSATVYHTPQKEEKNESDTR